MIIAIPCVENKLCMHFGHCQNFAFVSVNTDTKEIVSTEVKNPPPHEPGVFPKWVADNGATLVISGGMGQRAQQLFQQNGVDVLTGAPAEDPQKVARMYLDGSLVTGQNACDH